MKLIITALMSDGVVSTLIDGKRYTFKVDAAHFNRLQRMEKHSPGKAIAFLKKHNQLPRKELLR